MRYLWDLMDGQKSLSLTFWGYVIFPSLLVVLSIPTSIVKAAFSDRWADLSFVENAYWLTMVIYLAVVIPGFLGCLNSRTRKEDWHQTLAMMSTLLFWVPFSCFMIDVHRLSAMGDL